MEYPVDRSLCRTLGIDRKGDYVKDLTPREILDAIDRSLEKVAQQFAREQAETQGAAQQNVPAHEAQGVNGQSGKTGAES